MPRRRKPLKSGKQAAGLKEEEGNAVPEQPATAFNNLS